MLNLFIQETAGLATQKTYTQIQLSEVLQIPEDDKSYRSHCAKRPCRMTA